MNVAATTRILVPALATLVVSAYLLVQSGLAQVIFRGNLEPGSEAFWLAILLAAAGLLVLTGRGPQSPPASVVERTPLELVTAGRRLETSRQERSGEQKERPKAA